MNRSLVIDGNSYMWRSYYAYGLLNHGVLNGITRYVFDMIKRFEPSSVTICWDDGKSSWRSELYPPYKDNRSKKKEEIDIEEVNKQARLVRKFLSDYNIRSMSIRGVEADDLISWVSEYIYKFNNKQVVIITSDKDIWQLVNEYRIVYDHIKNITVDEEYVLNEIGVTPERIVEIRAMIGDKSDNIIGIHGIGEKTAIKLMNDYGSLKSMLNISSVDDLNSSKKTMKILDDYDGLNISYRLMKIPTLDEALYYLNDEQYDNICRIMCDKGKEEVLDRMKFHLYRDNMDLSFFPDKENISSLSFEDFTGILVAMGKKDEGEYISWSSLDDAINGCTKCRSIGNINPILPIGYEDAEVMIITDTPDENNRLLCEGSLYEKMLDDFLNEVGLDRRECWITSVNKCYPERIGIITKSEMNSCVSYLKSEIKLLRPKFIITMGSEAMSVVTPYKFGISEHCGEILDVKDLFIDGLDVKVAICVNFASVVRSVKSKQEMTFAISKIKEYLENT